MMHVYLAGPILGCTKIEANDWRIYAHNLLIPHGIIGISPLRCEPLIGERYGAGYPDDPRFGTARAIAHKNLLDVKLCHMTLAYLPKPEPGRKQSWGTICEVAWAKALDKPAIVVSDDPEVLAHPVVNSCAGWMLPTLEDGLDTLVGILGGYVPGGKNV